MCLTPDVGDYPSSHQYIICTASQHVSAAVSLALKDIGDFAGLKISGMLSKVIKKLDEATDPNMMIVDSDAESDLDENENEPEDGSENESENESVGGWSPQSPRRLLNLASNMVRLGSKDSITTTALNSRIRQDLRLVKAAGFRVGHLGLLFNHNQDSFVTISCRVAKLGISEEALQAWHLDSSQYFILLIRYTAGYRALDRLTTEEAWGQKTVEFRVGISKTYKTQISDAISAFRQTKEKATDHEAIIIDDTKLSEGLMPLFIGRPLDELLNDRLITLLRYRLDEGFLWTGAEGFYNGNRGCNPISSDDIDTTRWNEKESEFVKHLPPLVTADHLTEDTTCHSFPLLAMQFALRHLVRCTEFCLVCHCKVEEDFEALKPYVCSKPLCLYQYMALGFGPSIEHEIVSQPHVVDLLVSFCYASASALKLTSLPSGMGLLVPSPMLPPVTQIQNPVVGFVPGRFTISTAFEVPLTEPDASTNSIEPIVYKAKFDRPHMELIFPPGDRTLRVGHWIYLTIPGVFEEEKWHCRVIEALHPTVKLGTPVIVTSPNDKSSVRPSIGMAYSHNIYIPTDQLPKPAFGRTNLEAELTPAATPPSPIVPESSSLIDVQFSIYEQNFDDLSDVQKKFSICTLLDTLPSVREMKAFLQSKNGKDANLRSWTDRISPAALGLLRWIIASNRSCIIQVDNMGDYSTSSEERVSGMPEWMQFRFAQGAPDKEQRFVNSVRRTTKEQAYPTLFAWHGSPLPNWHGIVREGLHFRHTANGRAYGNGVYHALDVSTSLSYSCAYSRSIYRGDGSTARGDWPHSELNISEAIALNEIVNAPDQFVSKSPHLVIAQLDWIQSRYLFVKCGLQGQATIQDKRPTQVYNQDPSWTPIGIHREKILIPITAVSRSRRPVTRTIKTGNKKVKVEDDFVDNFDIDNAVLLSDDTDIDDITMLLSDDEDKLSKTLQQTLKGKNVVEGSNTLQESPQTDFVPGTLDHSTLPIMLPPKHATSAASKTLQRELANTLQIQNTHPAHELGWYIDPNLVNNVYQWIVELHSFEPELPIAKDMKDKNLTSVVLEIRFGNDYPISPPFVRIIRPRFLSFMAGGGGHVTSGGALCMELLTNSGWSAVSNIESVLLQVRLAISSTHPKPARLEPGFVRDYGIGEAMDAFIRACNAHGVCHNYFTHVFFFCFFS